jgi:hypothetical protein
MNDTLQKAIGELYQSSQKTALVTPNLTQMLAEETLTWEEIEAMYQDCARALCEVLSTTLSMVQNPQITHNITRPTEFKVVIDGLVRDMDQFSRRLVAIHEQHKDRAGRITTEDEVQEAYSLYSKYAAFFDNFKALTFQSLITITDLVGEAITKLNAQEKDAAQ